MMITTTEAGAATDEGRLSATAPSIEAPDLVHDGESYRIYRAVLPAKSLDIDAATGRESSRQGQKIDAVIKTCQPNPNHGQADLLSKLNNEYNILRLGQVAGCRSARAALGRDKSFIAPPPSDESGTKDGDDRVGTAIYLEWVEGKTLSDWLKTTRDEDTDKTEVRDESELLLEKVHVALGVANAVADIHEAGIMHNDLNGDNIILSFNDTIDGFETSHLDNHNSASSCRATIIDFEHAIQSSALEGTADGDRVNDDMPQLTTLLMDIFAIREGCNSNPDNINAQDGAQLPNSVPFGHKSSSGNVAFQNIANENNISDSNSNNNDSGSTVQSVKDSNGEEKTSADSSDAGSLKSGKGRSRQSSHPLKGRLYSSRPVRSIAEEGDDKISTASLDSWSLLTDNDQSSSIFGVSTRVSEDIDGGIEDDWLPRNLPRSMRRVLADMHDIGHGTRDSAYRNAREVAEDLSQMASDPAVFLADPRREDTVMGALRRPPRRLYGREKELAVLRSAEARLMDEDRGCKDETRTEVVLIAGHSGTGKSSLLQQARNDFRAVFAMGKFDQLRSMQPYSAVIDAFDSVVRSILAEDADVIADMRKDILSAVRTNGRVLTDVIPSLVKVIGEQPEVARVTGIEAQNRFRYIAQCFARAICTPRRPLIFALDDLQWCDSASIDLMNILVADESNKHLLFIGCYREDEMDISEHFDFMIKANVPFTTIKLRCMDLDSLTSFVSERVRLPRRLTKSLGEIVHRKSLGNAFFATAFLQSLAEGKLLIFSPSRMRWIWNEVEADAKDISDDVVEVMAEKIQSLHTGDQDVLKIASCIGAVFNSSIVKSLTAGASNDKALDKRLNNIAKQGLVIKMTRLDVNERFVQYKFSHDRIQQVRRNRSRITVARKELSIAFTRVSFIPKYQAAYSLIPKREKEELHLRIGRMLKQRSSDATAAGLTFKIVDQLNRGAECMIDWDEKVQLAVLNARAAEEAYRACAFTLSTIYAQKSLGILGDEDTLWNNQYDLALKLYNLLAELKYCEGDFNEAMQIAKYIFERAKTFEDQFIAQICNLKSMTLCGDLDDALTTSLNLLIVLGEPLPKKPSLAAVVMELVKTKLALGRKSDEYLRSLPEMTNDRVIESTKVLIILGTVAYLLGSNYIPIVHFRQIRLMVKHGRSEFDSFALSAYGGLCYAFFKDIKGAFRFGQLGLSLSNQTTVTRSSFVMHSLIMHWRDNIGLTLDPLLNLLKESFEIGDIEYACANAVVYSIHMLHSGQAIIQAIIQQQQACLQELTKFAPSSGSDLLRPTQQAALNLAGRSRNPAVLSGEVMDEEGLLRRSAESTNINLEYYVRMNAACVAYIFGVYDRASMHSLKIQDIANKFPNIYGINVQAFYDGLSSYQLARTTANRDKWKKRGRKMMKKFVKWAKDCPSNNTHKVLLLKAEDASLFAVKSRKKREIAARAYNAAILGANDSGFVNAAAIASERAAEFYSSIGQDDLFSSHMSQAYQLYFKWGAFGKCEYIAKKYPGIIFTAQGTH